MVDLLIYIVSFVAGFGVRHWYPNKFPWAEDLANQAKDRWDNR